MVRAILFVCLRLTLSACVAGAIVGAAVDVTGSVIGATVDVGGASSMRRSMMTTTKTTTTTGNLPDITAVIDGNVSGLIAECISRHQTGERLMQVRYLPIGAAASYSATRRRNQRRFHSHRNSKPRSKKITACVKVRFCAPILSTRSRQNWRTVEFQTVALPSM